MFVECRRLWLPTFDFMESQMNERERLDVLVKLSLEARSESFIKKQLAMTQGNEKARQLPELEAVRNREHVRQPVNNDCLNYTYGL